MVLEGSAPLSSNAPMEIFVLPSDRYCRSSYRRTFMLTFGRRIGLSIGEYRITFVVAIRAACAAAMQLSRWKPKTRAREPETTMSVCNCAREHRRRLPDVLLPRRAVHASIVVFSVTIFSGPTAYAARSDIREAENVSRRAARALHLCSRARPRQR